MTEILASLKWQWLHWAAIQVPAKAVFLYSIRQSAGGKISLRNSLGSHLLIEATVRFSTV